MTTVFIAGPIKIKHLDRKFKERIDKIIVSGIDLVVGDADGADTAIQTTLFEQGGSNTTVNEVKKRQRAAMGQSGETIWADVDNGPIHSVTPDLAPGSRAYFTAKDVAMAEAADYGLMMWDATSTGTLSNVIELLGRKKKSAVFVNKSKEFMTVGDVVQLQALVARMSEHARHKADEKLNLYKKIEALSREQLHMFA